MNDWDTQGMYDRVNTWRRQEAVYLMAKKDELGLHHSWNLICPACEGAGLILPRITKQELPEAVSKVSQIA